MIMKRDLTWEVTGALAAVWLCEGWGQPLTPSHCWSNTPQYFIGQHLKATLCSILFYWAAFCLGNIIILYYILYYHKTGIIRLIYVAWHGNLRPSLLVSALDIDLRAYGALRLVAFAGAVVFWGAGAGEHNTVDEISGCRLPKMSRVQYTWYDTPSTMKLT